MRLQFYLRSLSLFITICVLLASMTIIQHGCTGSVTYVRPAPPPLKHETPPPKPAPQAVWVAGYWHWNGTQYVWIAGHWELHPKGKIWIPGHWKRTPKGWRWVPGHWKK